MGGIKGGLLNLSSTVCRERGKVRIPLFADRERLFVESGTAGS